MIKRVLLLVVFALIQISSSLIINEINPQGGEFIEIYNEDEENIDLTSWSIKDSSNNNPDTLDCSENCKTNKEYFIIIGKNFDVSILDDNIEYFFVDDKTIGNGLTDKGDKIEINADSDILEFEYSKSSKDKSWNYCNGEYIEVESTRGMENNCQNENNNEEDKEEINNNENTNKEINKNQKYEKTANINNLKDNYETITAQAVNNNEVIYLNKDNKISEQQNIKTLIYESTLSKISKYSVYVFIILCLFIIAIYITKKIKYR